MYYLHRKNRNISIKVNVTVDGKDHLLEISTGTRDDAEARKRGPELLDNAVQQLRKPEVYCTIEPDLKKKYFECPLIKANHETRVLNWNELIDMLNTLNINTNKGIEYLGLIKRGKSLIRLYEDEHGNPHKLRRVRSIFNKKFLYWLEYEEGLSTSVFSHFVAYTPKSTVIKSFRVSDTEVEHIYKKGRELQHTHPEFFKIFILASSAGLRRSEILRLKWQDLWTFDGRNYVVLHETKAGEEQRVNIPASTYDALMEVKGDYLGTDYIIQASNRPKLLDRDFVGFLRSDFGITSDKPLHFLRKCLGAMLASKHGIYVASKTLRHASVTTTEKYYADLVAPANDIEIL